VNIKIKFAQSAGLLIQKRKSVYIMIVPECVQLVLTLKINPDLKTALVVYKNKKLPVQFVKRISPLTIWLNPNNVVITFVGRALGVLLSHRDL